MLTALVNFTIICSDLNHHITIDVLDEDVSTHVYHLVVNGRSRFTSYIRTMIPEQLRDIHCFFQYVIS